MIDWAHIEDAFRESYSDGWPPNVLLINIEDMYALASMPFPYLTRPTPIFKLGEPNYVTKVFGCQIRVEDVPVPIFARER